MHNKGQLYCVSILSLLSLLYAAELAYAAWQSQQQEYVSPLLSVEQLRRFSASDLAEILYLETQNAAMHRTLTETAYSKLCQAMGVLALSLLANLGLLWWQRRPA